MTSGDALDRQLTLADDFATVLTTIFARRYTGSFAVHCVDGVPRVVEFPGTQVRLAAPQAAAGGLDTPASVTDPT